VYCDGSHCYANCNNPSACNPAGSCINPFGNYSTCNTQCASLSDLAW
jgi:hypothetical protein